MPIYEYACPSCGNNFEKLQRVGAAAPSCPQCGDAHAHRKVSLSAFHLKGGGFYATDYASKGAGGSEGGTASDAGGSTSGGGHSCGSGCGCAH